MSRKTHVAETYRSGDKWRECDRCGFDYRISQLQKDPNDGLIVCMRCLDMPNSSPRMPETGGSGGLQGGFL